MTTVLDCQTVAPTEQGFRLDVYLTRVIPGLSRQKAMAWIATGAVRVDGRRAAKGQILVAGQVVAWTAPPQTAAVADDDCPLVVLLETEHLVAVAKPAGRHSAPQHADDRGTVAQALLARYPRLAGVGFSAMEPGLCHRLDFWTSGVLLAAKDQDTFRAIRVMFEQHRVRKEYLALVQGAPPPRVVMDEPIVHTSRHAPRVRVGEVRGRGALPACTEFLLQQADRGYGLVKAVCSTGAMHQVRAHAAHAGFPLLGDTLYGGSPEPDDRFWLHAASLALPQPDGRETLYLVCPPPPEFLARQEQLGL